MRAWSALFAACAGCGGLAPREAAVETKPVAAVAAKPDARLSASCAPRRDAWAKPVSGAGQGSAVALAREGARLVAYVADADSNVIHVADVDAGKQIGAASLGGSPREVVALSDGRVIATLADVSRVVVMEPTGPSGALETICERQVPAEAWGVAVSPDGSKIAVTSAWAAALTVLDGDDLQVESVHELPRDPRSVLLDSEGRAWVSHLVGGKLSVVDLQKGIRTPKVIDLGTFKSAPATSDENRRAKRTGGQGYALVSVTEPVRRAGEAQPGVTAEAPPKPTSRPRSRILAPMVSVDAGDASRPTTVYYGPPFDGVPKQAPFASVIDPDLEVPLSQFLLGTDRRLFSRECLLPRAAAVSAGSGHLYVACMGIDALLELDAWALDPFRSERRRFSVPTGPTGVAVDESTSRAVVFSQLDGALTVIDLARGEQASRTISLAYEPRSELAAAAAGRRLFYRTDDLRVSNDGVACASCHPDGRDDAITWTTPEGPRQTLSLAGRTRGTAPYGWVGHKGTLDSYIRNTVTRLGGQGIEEDAVRDVARFVEVAPPPPSSFVEDELVRRGRELFFDSEQACATCHVGGEGTDGGLHAVARYPSEDTKKFDTPSLRHLRGSGPYFHDGRYESLEELLADPEGSMGGSKRLAPPDRAAMAAFLRTL